MPNENGVSSGPTPGIQIDLRNNPSPIFFQDWNDISSFLSKDITAWTPFFGAYQQQVGRLGGALQNIISPHQNAYPAMVNQVNQLSTGKALDSSMKSAVEAIFQPYLSGICIHSDSPRGVFILSSSIPFPAEKFSAYIVAMSQATGRAGDPFFINTNNGMLPGIEYVLGMVSFKLFSLGLDANSLVEKERSESLNRELAEILSGAKSKLTNFEMELGAGRTSLNQMLQDLLNERRNITNDYEQFLSDIRKQNIDLRDEHEKGMEAIRVAFKDEIKLRAARNYWDKIFLDNKTSARTFWWIFVVSLPAAIVAISLAVNALIKFTALTLDKSEWFIIGLPTVLVLWVVRSIHRQWSTYNGLANDARERVTMVETYLALVSDGKMTELERPMVLQPLFRPSSVAGDDGMYKGIIDHLIDTMSQARGGH